ncbi:hypothetical protein EJ07DRAFT_160067 [Lizonia empirigonia]|nr:hypothetical protein EJ07DRAFT_160067 [Lizonia empirigonia]
MQRVDAHTVKDGQLSGNDPKNLTILSFPRGIIYARRASRKPIHPDHSIAPLSIVFLHTNIRISPTVVMSSSLPVGDVFIGHIATLMSDTRLKFVGLMDRFTEKFSALPRELRDKIYEQVIAAPIPAFVNSDRYEDYLTYDYCHVPSELEHCTPTMISEYEKRLEKVLKNEPLTLNAFLYQTCIYPNASPGFKSYDLCTPSAAENYMPLIMRMRSWLGLNVVVALIGMLARQDRDSAVKPEGFDETNITRVMGVVAHFHFKSYMGAETHFGQVCPRLGWRPHAHHAFIRHAALRLDMCPRLRLRIDLSAWAFTDMAQIEGLTRDLRFLAEFDIVAIEVVCIVAEPFRAQWVEWFDLAAPQLEVAWEEREMREKEAALRRLVLCLAPFIGMGCRTDSLRTGASHVLV